MAQAIEKQKQEDAAKAQAVANKKALSSIYGALNHYANGEITASLQNLERVLQTTSRATLELKKRARSLKEKITYSRSLYRRGTEEYQSGRQDMALYTWKRLINADKELLGKKGGYYSRIVGQKISDEYSSKALQAYLDDDLPTAYRYSEMALNIQRDHSKALEVKKMLFEKSKQLYQAGYILEEYNPEKAVEKWNQILEICTPDSEYYKKAIMKIGIR